MSIVGQRCALARDVWRRSSVGLERGLHNPKVPGSSPGAASRETRFGDSARAVFVLAGCVVIGHVCCFGSTLRPSAATSAPRWYGYLSLPLLRDDERRIANLSLWLVAHIDQDHIIGVLLDGAASPLLRKWSDMVSTPPWWRGTGRTRPATQNDRLRLGDNDASHRPLPYNRRTRVQTNSDSRCAAPVVRASFQMAGWRRHRVLADPPRIA